MMISMPINVDRHVNGEGSDGNDDDGDVHGHELYKSVCRHADDNAIGDCDGHV